MKAVKEYVFKPRSYVLGVIMAIVLSAGVAYLAVISIINLNPLIVILAGAIPAAMIYMIVYTTRLTIQYNEYDKDKTLSINEDRTELTITQGGQTVVITRADVTNVELYTQTDLGKFGRFNYLVIYTCNQCYAITCFTIPLLINDRVLESFLRKKPRAYFKKKFNAIDETRFKPLS